MAEKSSAVRNLFFGLGFWGFVALAAAWAGPRIYKKTWVELNTFDNTRAVEYERHWFKPTEIRYLRWDYVEEFEDFAWVAEDTLKVRKMDSLPMDTNFQAKVRKLERETVKEMRENQKFLDWLRGKRDNLGEEYLKWKKTLTTEQADEAIKWEGLLLITNTFDFPENAAAIIKEKVRECCESEGSTEN